MANHGNDWRRSSRRILLLWVLILVVAVLPKPTLAAAFTQAHPYFASPQAQTGGDGQYQNEPCSAFSFQLPANWKEGSDVVCGYLTVPEEHGVTGKATIRLAVVIVKSTNPNPPSDPLVILQGGPGGSTIDTYTQIIPLYGEQIRKDRDLVLFDQRGTLYSQPALTCPEVLDETIKNLDVKLTPEESQKSGLEALKACRARLERQGVNLSAFDSLQNAADVESLRLALGYDKINLYGVSYGTLLALHVMRNYPAGLRSVILDSTVPPQKNFLLDAPRSQNRSFEALFAACAQDADCNQAYPELRKVFYEQVDWLNKNPVHIQLIDTDKGKHYQALLDGDTLLGTTFQMMYNTDIIPFVPKTIYDARSGKYDFLERILSITVFDRTVSEGMYYSVNCAEEVRYDPKDFTLEGLPPEIQNLSKNDARDFLQTCQLWNVEPLSPADEQAVKSDIPTLVLSGAFDPITPPDYGKQAAQTLSHSYFVSFPNGGHGEMMTGGCPDSIAIQFLNNPKQPPDTACAAQLGGPKFITPRSVVSLPFMPRLLNLEPAAFAEGVVYILGVLFLLTALGAYPLAWLIRLLARPAQPAATAPFAYENPAAIGQAIETPVQNSRGLYRFAPWLASLTALSLAVFTGILFTNLFQMVTKNDQRVLVGLPNSVRPLFILPALAALLGLLMLAAMFIGWARRAGSVWGRLYFSLLTIAALACLVVLGIWGMLTALFVF